MLNRQEIHIAEGKVELVTVTVLNRQERSIIEGKVELVTNVRKKGVAYKLIVANRTESHRLVRSHRGGSHDSHPPAVGKCFLDNVTFLKRYLLLIV